MKEVFEMIKMLIKEHRAATKILTLGLTAALIYMFYLTKDSGLYTRFTYVALSIASFTVMFSTND